MGFYILLLFSASFFGFVYTFTKQKETAFLSKILCFLVLFVPAALRYNIGTDYPAYAKIFKSIANNMPTHTEIGWQFLNKTVYRAGGDAQCLFAVVAFFTFFLIFVSTNRKNFYLIIPLYTMLYYVFSYNATRQALAVSIIFYTIKREKNKATVIICLFLASLIHTSSLVFAVYFLLSPFFRIKKIPCLIIALFLYIAINVFDVVGIILNLASLTRYGSYLQTGYIRNTTYNTGLGVLMYFLMIFTVITGLNGDNRRISNSRAGVILFLFMTLSGTKIFILNRLRDGFMVMLLPALEEMNVASRYRKIFIAALLLFCAVSYTGILISGAGEVIPYTSIFGE